MNILSKQMLQEGQGCLIKVQQQGKQQDSHAVLKLCM
jgi:hypothetical protein